MAGDNPGGLQGFHSKGKNLVWGLGVFLDSLDAYNIRLGLAHLSNRHVEDIRDLRTVSLVKKRYVECV